MYESGASVQESSLDDRPVSYVSPLSMKSRDTRPISWVKAAQKAFAKFPAQVQDQILRALTVAADGAMSDRAKPLLGLGSGIFEVALKYRTDAYRTVYAVQLGEDIWVVHVFQKKSTKGRKTPQPEIDVTKDRLKRLKKELQQ